MTGWTIVLSLATFTGVSVSLSHVAGARLWRRPRRETPARHRPGRALVLAVVVIAALCCLAGAGPWLWAPLGGASAVAVVTTRLLRDARSRRERGERQHAVIELCDALSAELRAGLSAEQAAERSLLHRAEWGAIVSTARLSGDVSEALRRAAQRPGAEGLRAVAAGWQVAGRSGAGLASVLERVAAGLRADDEARAEVTASLGPPRATAKMLAVLPLFGLALGTSMGAQPLTFLLHTGVGLGCLFVGVGLATAGVVWVERLASSAEL
jgi:tight adherence protein B